MAIVVPNVFLTQTASLQTTLFRSYAYHHPKSDKWKVVIQGRRAYDIPTHLNLAKRLMLRGLLKRLEIGNEALSNPYFQRRVSGFLVTSDTPRKVHLKIDDHAFSVRRLTGKSGMFGGRITLPNSFFQNCERFGISLAPGRTTRVQEDSLESIAATRLFIAEKEGLSVISDIDDTIKQTDVVNRKQMLSRTFVDPFKPIGGMANVYQQWSQNYSALFHYVSSSPWQLYSSLEEFLDEFEFPTGSIHLRWFTLREEILKKWRLSRGRKKVKTIHTLIKRMPQRKFLLVGDSGEKDPDIYAEVASKHPQSVAGVLIRDLPQNPMCQRRVWELRSSLGQIPFRIFKDSEEVQNVLEEWRVVR